MSAIILARHATTTAALAVLFWLGAAAAVAVTHQKLDPLSPGGCATVSALIIVIAAYGYMRIGGREATVEQALLVGVTWTLLSIATELLGLTHSAHPYYPLLGSPDHTIVRDALLMVWISAPAVFARRRA
ncbi:MAG TPA: hypothetical protein VEZ11_08280 [Thermoanaerobaculia bacterium]|nr:hypothetical protein [Thermoanaerobaculia bacterium]